MKNKWKLGFFVILGIDIIFLAGISYLLLTPKSYKNTSKVTEPAGKYVPLMVQSNKEDLNRLINYYLTEEASDSPIDYQVHLGNEVELYGKMPFLMEQLNMKLTFEPEALKNGNLVLKQKSMSIGRLHLPVARVLHFIKENYQLPSGVDVQPSQKEIYINMQKMKLKSKMKVKVEKFDLKKNQIAFKILVPVK